MPSPAPLPWPEGSWRRELAAAVTDPAELLSMLGLASPTREEETAVHEAQRRFRLRVPRGFVARMRPGDPRDPLLAQVLPSAHETAVVRGFSTDPVGEQRATAHTGVLRKYPGRALLITTGACAVHCRYCFRRHFPYGDAALPVSGLDAAIERIGADASVREVILSGGDPLALTDGRLGTLLEALAGIDHVVTLRLHTRLPIVLPERVDSGLLRVLEAIPRPMVVVVHANHAQEVDDAVCAAIAGLRSTGVVVLNQAVLLAGVNDSVAALRELGEALLAAGVVPYYLHLLDAVEGAAHFDVPDEVGRRLVGELAASAPGYLVPRLVREVEGAPGKVQLPPLLPV